MSNAAGLLIHCVTPVTALARRPLEWAQPRLARSATTRWIFPCLVGRAPSPVVSRGLEQLSASASA